MYVEEDLNKLLYAKPTAPRLGLRSPHNGETEEITTMANNTTIFAEFQAAILDVFNQGTENDILMKAFTKEEDSLAETNACNGAALLYSLLTTACDKHIRANGKICTKESITKNANGVNSRSNITSKRVVQSLFFPNIIPRNSGWRTVLSTIRAAIYVIDQQYPELTRRAAEAVISMTVA